MNELKNRLLIKLLAGAVIGMLISLVICTFFVDMSELTADRFAFLKQFIGSGIYGAVAMGGSIAYEIESWGLVKATAVHYFSTMGAFLVANFLLKWFGTDILTFIVLGLTVGYFIIWIIEYSIWKKAVREMNDDLKHAKKERGVYTA